MGQGVGHDFAGGIQKSKILHALDGPVLYQLLDRLNRMLSRFMNLNRDPACVPGSFLVVEEVDNFRFNVLKQRTVHRLPRHRRVVLI
jgi:hypothetical protein